MHAQDVIFTVDGRLMEGFAATLLLARIAVVEKVDNAAAPDSPATASAISTRTAASPAVVHDLF